MIQPENGNPWDDLVADLGLPVETHKRPVEAPAPPPAKVETPAPAEEPVAEAAPMESAPVAEEPAPRGRRRRAPAVAAEPEAAPLFTEPEEPEKVAAPTEAAGAVIEPALEGEADAEAAPVEAGEEAAPRGRSRRRRRGRGSKSAAPANAAPAEGESEPPTLNAAPPTAEVQEAAQPTPAQDTPVEESEDQSRGRRGRGRGRRPERNDERRPGAAEQQEAEETPVEIEGELPEPATGDEEVDDLSNWNVPTWAELIASLYRPER